MATTHAPVWATTSHARSMKGNARATALNGELRHWADWEPRRRTISSEYSRILSDEMPSRRRSGE